ncbi:unnamed protein product, partial [Mesorhabditis spiculigera]
MGFRSKTNTSCVWRPTLACGGGALGCGIEGRVQVGKAVRSKEDAAVFWTELKKSQDFRGNLESSGTPCYGADDGLFGPNGKRFRCILMFEL